MLKSKNRKLHQIAGTWGLVFMTFPALLVILQLFVINYSNYEPMVVLKLHGSVGGQIFVYSGILITAIGLVFIKKYNVIFLILWATGSAVLWLVLYHIGWCFYFSLKFKNNYFFIPDVHGLFKLIYWLVIFFVYAFIESIVVSKHIAMIRKRAIHNG